jgi:endonuclease YncB( thermonuclease family)
MDQSKSPIHIPVTVLSIEDADTFVVKSGLTATIRTACIDCCEIPHSKQDAARSDANAIIQYKWGEAALTKIHELIRPGDTLMLRVVAVDRYRRNVAQVTLGDGKDLALTLVQLGLALVYLPYVNNCSNCIQLQSAEAQAKTEKVGIWSEPKPIVMPWEFRASKFK